MNTLSEINAKIAKVQSRKQEIVALGKKEERKLNDGETTELNGLNDELKQLEGMKEQIEKRYAEDIAELERKKNEKQMEKRQFSILAAVRSIADNTPLDNETRAVMSALHQECRAAGVTPAGQIVLPMESRTINTSTAGAGGVVVDTELTGIVGPLRDALVLVGAGATFMTGLTSPVDIPKYSGSTSGWAGEGVAGSDGKGTFSKVSLSPKKLTTYLEVTKEFLMQDSVGAEAMLRNDIINSIREKLESTVLSASAGTATSPAGVFDKVAPGTAAAPTFAGLVGMEQKLEEAKVTGTLTYIMAPAVKASLRTIAKDAGSGVFLMNNGEVNGIKAISTNLCAAKHYMVGDFSHLIIGGWGGIDLTIDPYSKSKDGIVCIVVNSWWDAVLRHDTAIVTAKIA